MAQTQKHACAGHVAETKGKGQEIHMRGWLVEEGWRWQAVVASMHVGPIVRSINKKTIIRTTPSAEFYPPTHPVSARVGLSACTTDIEHLHLRHVHWHSHPCALPPTFPLTSPNLGQSLCAQWPTEP